MPDNVSQTIVRLDIDRPAAKRVETSTKRVNDLLDALQKQVKSLDSELRRQDGIARIETSSKGARRALDTLKDEASDTRREIKRLDSDMANARGAVEYEARIKAAAQSTELYGDVGSRTRDIGGGIAALGGQAIEQKFFIASDLLDAAEGFGRIKAEMPALINQLDITPPKIAAVAVATVAVGAAYLTLRDNLNDWKDAAKTAQQATVGQIDALKEYYSFIGDATREDVKARIDEVNKQQGANAQLLEDLEQLRLAIESGLDVGDRASLLDKAGEGAVRALDALGALGFGLDEVKDAINEAQTAQQGYQTEFSLLVQAYLDGTTAINDAEKAQREANERKISALERETQWQIQYATSTQDAVDDRLAAIDTEKRAQQELLAELEAMAGTSEEAAAQLGTVRDRIATLTDEENYLTNVIYDGAVARTNAAELEEQLTEAREKAADAIKEAIEREKQLTSSRITSLGSLKKNEIAKREALDQKALDAERTYNDKLAALRDERAIDLTREAEDFALNRIRDIANHYADLADMDQKYAEDRQSIVDGLREAESDVHDEMLDELADYNKETQRAAKDHQRNLARIQRDGNRDVAAAVARLDAWAVHDAQQRTKDQLDDAQEQYDDEKKIRDEDYKDRLKELEKETQERKQAAAQQLRDLAQQHQRERQAQQAAFAQQLQREDQNRRIALQRQQEDWNREDSLARSHYVSQQNELRTAYAALENETRLGMNRVKIEFAKGIAALSTITTSRSGAVSAAGRTKSYAVGGLPPVGQDVLVGESGPEIARFLVPTRIYPSGSAPTSTVTNSTGPMTFNIYESGNPAKTEAAVLRVLDKVLA